MKHALGITVLLIGLFGQISPSSAAVATFTDEAAFLRELETVFKENFEGDAWAEVRSSATSINAATNINNQGITWSSAERVTTSLGAGRSGYGIYSHPHGIPDSFTNTTAQHLIAVGGWFVTNTPPAQIHFIIDDALTVDFNDAPVNGVFAFRGIISTEGFQKVQFKEVEGTPGDQKFIFADDFTFSLAEISGNIPPTADAGTDQTVTEATLVMLDGSDSSDPDDAIASYLWEQVTTIEIPLSDPTSARPTFTAPLVGPAGLVMTFELTVTDMFGAQDTDRLDIRVNDAAALNQPPTANAGADQSVEEGAMVTLDGSASSDGEGEIISYQWSIVSGTEVTLSDAAVSAPVFVAPPVSIRGEAIVFSLEVTDQGGMTGSDEVTVNVSDRGIAALPPDMIPLRTHMGDHLGIKVISGGDLVGLGAVDAAEISTAENRPENIRFGLIDMRIKTDSTGGTAAVEIALPNPAEMDETWFKYDDADGWRNFSDHAVFTAARDHVTLTLTDGGNGDSDHLADGMITDPSGIGTPRASMDGEASDSGGGCFIATLTN